MNEPITPPIVVAFGDDCDFHREVADAVLSGIAPDAKVFDALGRRLVAVDGALQIAPGSDGADELAELLRDWLGYMDALRESTSNWSLALLVRASVDHLGYG